MVSFVKSGQSENGAPFVVKLSITGASSGKCKATLSKPAKSPSALSLALSSRELTQFVQI